MCGAVSLALTRQLTPEAKKGGYILKQGTWLKALMVAVILAAGNMLFSTGVDAAALRLGDGNADVKVLQERLNSLGYDVGYADGVFGRRTEQAVRAVQADNGLEPDGIVGDGTWSVLRSGSVSVSRGLGGRNAAGGIISVSRRYLGVPYVWGGTTPDGFDCSGFTQYVFDSQGIRLPRTADAQFEMGMPVRYGQWQPGDLVFFSTYEPGPSHSGVYLGDGRFISATSSRGIAVDRMESSYWGPRYVGARRVIR